MNIGNEYIGLKKKKKAAGYHFLQFLWHAEIILHQSTNTHTHVCSLLQHLKKNYISVSTFMPKTHYWYIRWQGRFLKHLSVATVTRQDHNIYFYFNFGKPLLSAGYDLQACCMRTTLTIHFHFEFTEKFYICFTARYWTVNIIMRIFLLLFYLITLKYQGQVACHQY